MNAGRRQSNVDASREGLRIVVVDDEADQLELVRRILSPHGHEVALAMGGAEAVALLEDKRFDLLITDLRMPDVDGLTVLKRAQRASPSMGLLVMTGFPSTTTAIESTKLGAHAYLEKPFAPTELVEAVAGWAVLECEKDAAARAETLDCRAAGERWGLIGESQAMLDVLDMLPKVARSDAAVLLQGESGTGKELVARSIHRESARSAARFLAVNCSALPSHLIESELFGHVRGAFTDAGHSKRGLFEAADGGTLLLDEIGELSLEAQAKLLRVLEDGRVRPIGATRSRDTDVRVIAATNRDLGTDVAAGRFRRDLYHRIHVVKMDLPPLRDRGDDVVLLARHFLNYYATKENRPVPRVTDSAAQTLLRYSWPGNVREIKHLAQRILVTHNEEELDVGHLPPELRRDKQRQATLGRTLEEAAFAHIQAVLASVDGNQTRAARILGISRKTLGRKFRRHKH